MGISVHEIEVLCLDIYYKPASRTQSVASNDSGHGSSNELDSIKASSPVRLRKVDKYGVSLIFLNVEYAVAN